MARKGRSKSTTGCNTCKVRKVKCDETKPRCQKCTTTSRTCDYEAQQHSKGGSTSLCIHSNLSRHRPRSLPTCHSHEGRALRFFWDIVGPVLSDSTDTYFWGVLLAQFSYYEPVVRHALVAMSALYEELHRKRDPLAYAVLLPPNSMALFYYNAAIRELVVSRNSALTLLVCVLFTCIEFIQGHYATAIQHCHHGIAIFNERFSQSSNCSGSGSSKALSSPPSWVCEHLFPILRRLSIVPLFFGSSVASFPCINGLYDELPVTFATLADAQHALDNLICRSMRFVRSSYEHQLSVPRQYTGQSVIASSLRTEHAALQTHLNAWRKSFIRSLNVPLLLPQDEHTAIRLQIKHRVAKIWVDMALQGDEDVSETCLADFASIEHLAMAIDSRHTQPVQAMTQSRPKFVEMGFLPLLHFVVARYQTLDLRVATRSLVKALAVYKKNLWHLDKMPVSDSSVIELSQDMALETVYSPPQGILLYIYNIKSQQRAV